MEIKIQLDSQHTEQLAYIQQHAYLDPVVVITEAIEREYQQLQSSSTQNPLSNSPFIGCFQGSPDLATNSKSIVNDILREKFPPSEIHSS